MTAKKITVEAKPNYGRFVFYPLCDNAHLFAEIARTTTLTTDTLKKIIKLGYEIECQSPSFTALVNEYFKEAV